MDNITHTLTGLMMSRAGLKRLSPRAGAIAMIAANIPDVDVISGFWGAPAYFHYHRWYTHAWLMIPVMAVLPVLIVRLFTRKGLPWGRAYAVSLIAAASHPLLDFTNPYGIRFLMPFSYQWPSLDIVNVFDLWLWGVLFIAAAWPSLSGLVSSEIGARQTQGSGWAIFALAFIPMYDGARLLLKEQAVGLQESRVYNGATPRRVSVMPSAANPFLWQGVVETDEFFILQDVNLLGDFDPTLGRVLYKRPGNAATDAAQRTRVFQDIMGFSKALLWRTMPDTSSEGAQRVEASDLRFGFTAYAIVNARNEVERTGFAFGRPDSRQAK